MLTEELCNKFSNHKINIFTQHKNVGDFTEYWQLMFYLCAYSKTGSIFSAIKFSPTGRENCLL